MRDKNAFTLIEILIVVILLSVIAAFGVPNYSKALSHGQGQDARTNLQIIEESVRLYCAQNNESYPGALGNVNLINTTLHLNVIEQNGTTYSCAPNGANYICTADSHNGWELNFELGAASEDVKCSVGSCP